MNKQEVGEPKSGMEGEQELFSKMNSVDRVLDAKAIKTQAVLPLCLKMQLLQT